MNADPRDHTAPNAGLDPDAAARLKAEQQLRLRQEALLRAQARLNAQTQQPAPASASQKPAQPVRPVAPPSVSTNHRSSPPPVANPAPRPAPQVTPPAPPVAQMAPDDVRQPAQSAGEDANLDFLGGQRDLKDFVRANRHSGRVRILRVVLPLVGIFILSMVIGAYIWSQSSGPAVSIQSAGMEDGRMVMSNPKIDGVDDQQRPYTLLALEAIQDPANLGKVELTGIDAKVPMADDLFANILAGKGFYDSDAKTLKLDENIDVRTDDGTIMSMKDADIDMDKGTLQTTNPVSIATEGAKISADSFVVENNGKRVVFENRVRMTIYPSKFDKNESAASPAQEN